MTDTIEQPLRGRKIAHLGALTVGLAVLLLLAPGQNSPILALDSASAGCANAKAMPRSVINTKAERAVICLINKKRKKRGQDKLILKRQLARAAGSHSKTMRDKHCFAHTCNGEPSLGTRLERANYLPCGCRFGYGETIAWGPRSSGTPRSIFLSWMRSKQHRKILLANDYEHVGVGVSWGSPSRKSAKAGIYTVDVGFRN